MSALDGLDFVSAINQNDVERLQTLLARSGAREVMEKVTGGRSALVYAASLGRLACVKCLLENGANVNGVTGDVEGTTALLRAVQQDHVACARALLEAGADTEVCAEEPGVLNTPLWEAVCAGSARMVKFLVEFRVELDDQDVDDENGDDTMTPLMYAARHGFLDVVDVLVGAGCDLNFANDEGHNALVCSLLTSHRDIARRLVSAGADMNSMDHEGKTPLNIAVEQLALAKYPCDEFSSAADPELSDSEEQTMVTTLLSAGADTGQALLYAVSSGRLADVQHLVSYGGSSPVVYQQQANTIWPHDTQQTSMSLLELAWARRHLDIATYLMQIWFFTPRDVTRFGLGTLPGAAGHNLETAEDGEMLRVFTATSWSLEVLSFVRVSSALTSQDRCERQAQVNSLAIPAVLKRRLLFQNVS